MEKTTQPLPKPTSTTDISAHLSSHRLHHPNVCNGGCRASRRCPGYRFPAPADVKHVDRSMLILGGCDWYIYICIRIIYDYMYIYVCVCDCSLSAGNVRLCKVATTNIYI